MKNIMTIKVLKEAIKSCDLVMIQPRFGISEKWVKLSKVEAMDLVNSLTPDTTPQDIEMYGGSFGDVVNNILYLG